MGSHEGVSDSGTMSYSLRENGVTLVISDGSRNLHSTTLLGWDVPSRTVRHVHLLQLSKELA